VRRTRSASKDGHMVCKGALPIAVAPACLYMFVLEVASTYN
jgi:hypothetical protein